MGTTRFRISPFLLPFFPSSLRFYAQKALVLSSIIPPLCTFSFHATQAKNKTNKDQRSTTTSSKKKLIGKPHPFYLKNIKTKYYCLVLFHNRKKTKNMAQSIGKSFFLSFSPPFSHQKKNERERERERRKQCLYYNIIKSPHR